MNTFNEDQLYQYFKDAIQRSTAKELEGLEEELRVLKEDVYRKLNQSFEQRKNETLKIVDDSMKLEQQKFLSRLEQNLNRVLANYREELVQSLMNQVEARYHVYQQSKAYEESLVKAIALFDAKTVALIRVAAVDVDKIKSKVVIHVESDPQISAGYKAYYKDGKREVDETLESKLIEARNWFYQNVSIQLNSETNEEVKA